MATTPQRHIRGTDLLRSNRRQGTKLDVVRMSLP
jgi:hypothetical protein